MDVREKLVEQLRWWATECDRTNFGCQARKLLAESADYIANDVTVQERGHWVSYESDEPYGCADDKEWHRCSKCGKDAYGRCHEDEWYSAPILSAYCPHCGAKMMPQPPKGE
jgi:hypothetical protein